MSDDWGDGMIAPRPASMNPCCSKALEITEFLNVIDPHDQQHLGRELMIYSSTVQHCTWMSSLF